MIEKDIVKEYGQVFHDANYIINNPPPVISVSPKLDIALGGGVPEGCFFIMTGPEKVGKTLTALQFCRNAQKVKRDDGEARICHYGNVEARLRRRDILGIQGLNYDPEVFKIIGSSKGNILSGEKYLGIFDYIVNHDPHCVLVVDSFSALAAEDELTQDITDVQVAAMARYLAKFSRRFQNVLPINRVTLVGITHMMANIQSFGKAKAKTEKSGTALKYAQDVKLHATHKKPLMQGETQIGQEVHWIIENSALSGPSKTVSYIKYGRGIWNEYEVYELAADFGLLDKKGSWVVLPNGEKVQGKFPVIEYLENNPEVYEDLRTKIYEMTGIN